MISGSFDISSGESFGIPATGEDSSESVSGVLSGAGSVLSASAESDAFTASAISMNFSSDMSRLSISDISPVGMISAIFPPLLVAVE